MKKSTVDNIIMTMLNGPKSSRQVKFTIKKYTHSTTLTYFYMFQKSTVIVYSMTVCCIVLWAKFKPAVVV